MPTSELPAPLRALAARIDVALDEVEKARGLGAYEAMVAIRRVCVEAADVRDEVARIMAAAWRWS